MKNGTAHQVPQKRMPPVENPISSANQIAVSRSAGPSLRCISSFIFLRGMSV